MVAILKKILGQRQLKKAGMETYGEKEEMQQRSAAAKAKRKEWINKGLKAVEEYAAKAPERRAARINKLNQQAQLATAEARLMKAQAAKRAAGSAAGSGMGAPMFGPPSMGVPRIGPPLGTPKIGQPLGTPMIGPPAAAPKKRSKARKKKGRSITITL